VRSELGDVLPEHGVDAVLAAYRGEGRRLVATAQAVDLVGRALRGEMFRPQIRAETAGPRQQSPRQQSPKQQGPEQQSPRQQSPRQQGPKQQGPKQQGPEQRES